MRIDPSPFVYHFHFQHFAFSPMFGYFINLSMRDHVTLKVVQSREGEEDSHMWEFGGVLGVLAGW